MTIFTESLLCSKLRERFKIYHLDTSDHRDLSNLGLIDFWNVFYAIKNIFELIILCIRKNPAIVYVPIAQNTVSFLRDGLFVLTAQLFSQARTVLHYHGGESFFQFRRSTNFLMKSFIRLVLRRAEVVIVLGDRLRDIFDGEVKRVIAVHNGTTFLPRSISEKHGGYRGLIVSFLSNLSASKGILDFLNAALSVTRSHPSTKFRIAGEWWQQEPETEREAKRIIKANSLQECIKFTGPLYGQTKELFLLETDIFVFPTWNDSFGLVILEAMAAACPVISTKNVGVIGEVVVDGVTGILVEKQNPIQLAHAINTLIENPDLRRRMGEAGRKRFEEHFTFDKCAERIMQVFQQALES